MFLLPATSYSLPGFASWNFFFISVLLTNSGFVVYLTGDKFPFIFYISENILPFFN